jgi:hypothetical protein
MLLPSLEGMERALANEFSACELEARGSFAHIVARP